MYKINDNSVLNRIDNPLRYIQDNDYYNAILFRLLPKQRLYEYVITKPRYDLISEELYGKSSYDWLLLLINGIKESDLIRGNKIKYITNEDFKELLIKITNEY